MSWSFEHIFSQDVIDVITLDNKAVLIALVYYLRTHYELHAALDVRVDASRRDVILLSSEDRPVQFLVSREFLTSYQGADLAQELDNRWFLGALIHACRDTELIVLGDQAVEKIRRT